MFVNEVRNFHRRWAFSYKIDTKHFYLRSRSERKRFQSFLPLASKCVAISHWLWYGDFFFGMAIAFFSLSFFVPIERLISFPFRSVPFRSFGLFCNKAICIYYSWTKTCVRAKCNRALQDMMMWYIKKKKGHWRANALTTTMATITTTTTTTESNSSNGNGNGIGYNNKNRNKSVGNGVCIFHFIWNLCDARTISLGSPQKLFAHIFFVALVVSVLDAFSAPSLALFLSVSIIRIFCFQHHQHHRK